MTVNIFRNIVKIFLFYGVFSFFFYSETDNKYLASVSLLGGWIARPLFDFLGKNKRIR